MAGRSNRSETVFGHALTEFLDAVGVALGSPARPALRSAQFEIFGKKPGTQTPVMNSQLHAAVRAGKYSDTRVNCREGIEAIISSMSEKCEIDKIKEWWEDKLTVDKKNELQILAEKERKLARMRADNTVYHSDENTVEEPKGNASHHVEKNNHVPDLVMIDVRDHKTNSSIVSGRSFNITATFREHTREINGELFKLKLKRCLVSTTLIDAEPRNFKEEPVIWRNTDQSESIVISSDAQGSGGSKSAEWRIESTEAGRPLRGIFSSIPFLVVDGDIHNNDKVELIFRPLDLHIRDIEDQEILVHDAWRVAQKWVQDRLDLSTDENDRTTISVAPLADLD